MHEKVTRFEQAAVDRRLKGYVGFSGVDKPSSLPRKGELTSPGAYAPPRLVPSTAYARPGRIGGREVFAWALAFVLAVVDVVGMVAWAVAS